MSIFKFFRNEDNLTEEDVKAASKLAYEKGYDDGYKDGYKKSKDENHKLGWNDCLDNIEKEMRWRDG